AGEVLGLMGLILAVVLAICVLPISLMAVLLLLPYLVWTPIGTYTTEELKELNPQDA
ncbi:MAG: tryptophan-rich sensory protein, partial [Nostoc sp.]